MAVSQRLPDRQNGVARVSVVLGAATLVPVVLLLVAVLLGRMLRTADRFEEQQRFPRSTTTALRTREEPRVREQLAQVSARALGARGF